MSAPNPFAFPSDEGSLHRASDSYGMELRDYFAARVIGEIVNASLVSEGCAVSPANAAEAAYAYADAMLAKRIVVRS